MNWIEIALGFILWLVGIVIYLAIFGLSEEPGGWVRYQMDKDYWRIDG